MTMKRIILLILAAHLLLGLSACSDKLGDCGDDYKAFPVTEFTFGANGGSQNVPYKNENWWVGDFIVDSVYYYVEFSCDSLDTLTTPYACYSTTAAGVRQLEGLWLTMQWSAPKQLTLIVEPNTTGKSRKVEWFAGYGNCGHALTVTQSAE